MKPSSPLASVDKYGELMLRPAALVMNLERLGSLYPTRLSFMRSLLRKIMAERWRIERSTFDLDAAGYGTVIYRIHAPGGLYTFVAFAHQLDPDRRSDRVIANEWDMTATLCAGQIDGEHLERLRQNVPRQEAGRVDARSIVLSRANRSVRNFDYVVNELAAGRQPSFENLARVGYLYRTTAVYGSGKFGMADWDKVRTRHADFARPFAAEMFTCYMIRQFSLDQAEFLAHSRAPQSAVALADDVRRFFGIGNATGLGMAPYLINHPALISRWLEVRETARARVLRYGEASDAHWRKLGTLIAKAIRHLGEIATDNAPQHECNQRTIGELRDAHAWVLAGPHDNWHALTAHAERHWHVETQEVLDALLMELYPKLIDDLEDRLCVDEQYRLIPEQPLAEFKATIETHYDWALAIDFSAPESQAVFWYRSAEKLEPRLGQSGIDGGQDRQMNVAVARTVRECYDEVCVHLNHHPDCRVAEFALRFAQLRGTIRRIQSMAQTAYGDIRANLVDIDVLPIHLLRCKLSFFGVSKFDPKSRLWVRNTMFQGAPVIADIGKDFADDWYFPVMPDATDDPPN